ncbi:DUF2459 domain-containing protein [Aquimarina sp. BL5]|uniref:DUF2459 domain-containing protein n=1 Tax=Aquimarina sp. BL5 TaxID=1714860 RepID=UPI000E4D8B3E|nr:DUF2459 domain-containing protein [Aquimarina sp. BL5]AXT52890.1 DUF2459 domain-containing protein [Aquimarina sp. BL5]RKN02293.1 DUF2459 domain-containing protein [Aquimarina sp. BL5]
MQLVKKILKCLGVVLLIPITYLIVALVCSYIPVTPKTNSEEQSKSIYLATNGIHLEIIIPKTEIGSLLHNGLRDSEQTQFLSFGWGDKTYYTKTAKSMDFNNLNRFQAALLNSPSLIHVTRYTRAQCHWIEIKITATQLIKLQTYIKESFKTNTKNTKAIVPEISYGSMDNFYKANGSYNCLNTCNTWVNTGFKQSDLKSCLWTPFDFGLLKIHKN